MEEFSKEKIRDILVNELSMILRMEPVDVLHGAPLHSFGLDSLGFVELLVSIEKKFNIKLIETSLKKEDFENINILSERIYSMLENV